MSANKPQPQQGGQKPNPNKEDEYNKGQQDRDQNQKGGHQKDKNMPNQRGQGGQGGGR